MSNTTSTIPLGPGPVVVDLITYIQNGYTALLSAKSIEDFNESFNGLFSSNVNVTLNGKHISREEYSKQLSALNLSKGASGQIFNSIKFEGTLEVPDVTVPGVQVSLTTNKRYTSTMAYAIPFRMLELLAPF